MQDMLNNQKQERFIYRFGEDEEITMATEDL